MKTIHIYLPLLGFLLMSCHISSSPVAPSAQPLKEPSLENWLRKDDTYSEIFSGYKLVEGVEYLVFKNCWERYKEKLPLKIRNIEYFRFESGEMHQGDPLKNYFVQINPSLAIRNRAAKDGQLSKFLTLLPEVEYEIDRKSGKIISERIQPSPHYKE